MRQLILDALKARFVGVSEKILGRIADKLAKTITTEEQISTAVEGMTFQQIIDSEGDRRATEAQQTAVAHYEAKHGLKDGRKVGHTEQNAAQQNAAEKNAAQQNAETPAWAQTLIEGYKALSEQVRTMQSEKLTATRREQITEILSPLPEYIRKAYSRTPVDALSDEDFEVLKGEIKAETAEIARQNKAQNSVYGRPLHRAGNQTQTKSGVKAATEEEVNAVINKLHI